MMSKQLVAIFLAAILTENYILNKFLGICPFLGVSKKLNTAVGMSCAVTFVMVLSTAVTWPIYTYLLVPERPGLFADHCLYPDYCRSGTAGGNRY